MNRFKSELICLVLLAVTVFDVAAQSMPQRTFGRAYQAARNNYIRSTPSYVAVTDGLVSYWPFNNNSLDSVSTNTGYYNSAYVFKTNGITGAANTAFYFYEGFSWMSMGPVVQLRLTNALTLTCWIKPVTNHVNGTLIARYYGAADQRTFNLSTDTAATPTGKITWRFPALPTTVGVYTLTSSNAVPSNAWTYVAATFQGGTNAAIYINGVLDASTTTVPANIAYVASVAFIVGDNEDFKYFPGSIDEVKVYGRSLAAPELLNNYNAEKP